MVRLFAVVTWGASASYWLARALNAQPNVLCLHHIPCVLERLGASADSFAALDAVAQWGKGYDLAGDCHGIDLYSIPMIRRQYGDRFSAVAITRHPIPRLRSAIAHIEKRGLIGDRVHAVYRAMRVPGDRSQRRVFRRLMPLVNRIAEESVLPIFKMEDLTSDPDCLDRLLRVLSDGVVGLSSRDLDVWRPANVHAGDSVSPEDVWQSWPEWCRRSFAKGLLPESRRKYETLGYDLSFM